MNPELIDEQSARKRGCCSRCDGCDRAEYREEDTNLVAAWYCIDCEAPCDEIRKCPWSV